MAVLGAAQLGAILTILQVIKIRIFSEHSLGWHLTRRWGGGHCAGHLVKETGEGWRLGQEPNSPHSLTSRRQE